jgi:hypothetical protein
MSLKTLKKYSLLAFISLSFFISIKVNAQYPVYIYDSNPFIQFWVTTQGPNGTTTLDVKDINSNEILKTLKELSSTTENLYTETLRNNYWMMYNEETRNEKEQSLSKYKALKLQNVIEENILSWVNEGFNVTKDGGKPAYIEDEALFFNEMEIKIRENFQKFIDRFYEFTSKEERVYLEKIKKILSSMTENALTEDDYYANDSSSGPFSQETIRSWDDWVGINLDGYTNPDMAFSTAESYLNNLISIEKEKYSKEIENGNGFLSFKRCKIDYYNIETGQLGYGGEDEPPLEDYFFGDPYYQDDIWSGAPGGTYPVVSCTTIIPGYLIAEQVSEIYRSKYNFIKQTAISTNGNDLVLDSIEKDLKDFQKKIFEIGIIGRDSSTEDDALYSDLNDAIEKASEELKKRDGGNTKISEDIDDPRNTNSRFYPKNFLTDEKWKEIWDFKENTNNNWYNWFDFLYNWVTDNWKWN